MKKILFGALICSAFMTSAQTYTFTTAGVSGRFGPTQVQVDAAYTATTLNGLEHLTTSIVFSIEGT